MQWAFYGAAAAIIVLAAWMWVRYLNRMDMLADDLRGVRRSIQQTLMAIEERQAHGAAAAERLTMQRSELDGLSAEVVSAEALLAEMIRKEQRRNPEAFEEDGSPRRGSGDGA